ncbi:MAG TPA: ATP-binding protein [Acidobacteriota bacterium]|nr:ATP-binding protein [Acidobacteriota bacterium]
MNWDRTRYGLPVTSYQWVIGLTGIFFLLLYSFARTITIPVLPFAVFLALHVAASFLHFQYARLNVVITFESAFTTATLLTFGPIPAVWVSVMGIVFGSIRRVVERRFVLRKSIPAAYDIGIIVFNCGMVGAMWLVGGWVYVWVLKGSIPLVNLTFRDIGSILVMYCAMSLVNHVVLLVSSYLRGQDSKVFVKKALFPAFLTELATIPFGVVMALSYSHMGLLAFLFLGVTLLLSNAVLRNLSVIRYDQEEKLRQMAALNSVSRQIIALRDEESVIRLLYNEVGKVLENQPLFLAMTNSETQTLRFLNAVDPALESLGQLVATARQPVLITNTKKHAPEGLKKGLLEAGIRSCLLIPILAADNIHGVLGVYSEEFSAFKFEHMQLLIMIADEAGLALENSKLYDALTDKVSQLERLNKELRQLDKMKSEFLANVSHELRTPLTCIKGYVEFIRKEKLGPITQLKGEGLNVAQRNILRLERLINDLLDYTRLEFKRTPLTLTACTLQETWNDVQEEYSEAIRQKHLSVHVMIQPDLPLLYVDPQRLYQVLSNLVSNAIKFTSQGGIVWIDAHPLKHAEDYYSPELYRNYCDLDLLVPVEISVRDNGVGIPPEAMSKIFDRFYQVDSSNTRKYGGTGLGLAIVKSIMEAHGTRIHVQSTPNEGSSFTFVIPAIQPANVSTALKPAQLHTPTQPKYVS